MQRLVLIDGHAILHRAYHALPPLTNRSGDLVNAVYGFCTILLKVIDDLHPQYLAVAFDTPKPTFRQDIFIGYQAKRPKMAEELAGQIEKVQKLLVSFRIPIFAVEGYEADDVIGTIIAKTKKTKNLKNKKLEIIVVSGDRDLFQLVSEDVKLYMPIKGISGAQFFGEEEIKKKIGVCPSLVVDYKGLVGDSSDNYPGVLGIGPKTAISLLQKFGSLENIYKNLDLIDNKSLVEKLLKGKEGAFLSKKLATIVKDVPVEFRLEDCELKDLKNEQALRALRELGFRSLVSRLVKDKKEEKEEKKEKEKEFQQRLF